MNRVHLCGPINQVAWSATLMVQFSLHLRVFILYVYVDKKNSVYSTQYVKISWCEFDVALLDT